MMRDIDEDGKFEDHELFYYTKDHLNSVKELLDHNGAIYQRYSYTAYGETTIEKQNSSSNLIENRYAFTSRELDEHTGLYHYRARYYDPNSGRFISEDPIGFKGEDFNLYRYVRNNPIKYRDPTGQFAGADKVLVGVCAVIVVRILWPVVIGTYEYLVENYPSSSEESDNASESKGGSESGGACPKNEKCEK